MKRDHKTLSLKLMKKYVLYYHNYYTEVSDLNVVLSY